MNKSELRNFLNKHPLKELSIASLSDFKFRILLNDDFNNEVGKMTGGLMPTERLAEEKETAKAIEAIRTPEDLMLQMRKPAEFSNMTALVKKALEMEDDALPLIVARYRKAKHEFFIENASRIFSRADKKYVEELRDCYKDIWHPHAQALACLLFGYLKLIDTIPLLLSEYERFRRLYPDETYDQCPLLALEYLWDEMTE